MNNDVLKALPTADRVLNIYAHLVTESGDKVYDFLFNPEEKRFDRRANYIEGITAFNELPSQQYIGASGLILSLPNLLLETYSRGLSLSPLLESLQQLLLLDPATKQPTPVYFVWGSSSFGPAVLTNVEWSEMSWLGGEPASARVSLTLLQIPPKDDQPNLSASEPSSEINLTERQREDARRKAGDYLKESLSSLPDSVADAVRANRFSYLTSPQGEVKIIVGSDSYLVGIYNGTSLNTEAGEL